ncbi:hypothetical protein ARSEF4850_001289 [Beauveria asiatica]
MNPVPKPKISAEQFDQALRALDVEIGKSKNISKIKPVQLLSAGGFVAVTLFRNRFATEDIDYIINPDAPNVDKIMDKFQAAIERVAKQRNLDKGWINTQMEIFVTGRNRQSLFRDSVTQIIYAAKWEWTMARELKRIGSENRKIDLSDAVEILAKMVQENGGPLALETVQSWDTIVYTTPLDMAAIKRVADAYRERWGVDGINM